MLEAEDERLHFKTEIEVLGRSPQAMLDDQLVDFDPGCGPLGDSVLVTRGTAPSINLIELAKVLAGLIRGRGPDRFFVYGISGSRPRFLVREGRLPPEALQQPGATFELVAAFPDEETAAQAWKRLERGFKKPTRPKRSIFDIGCRLGPSG